MDQYRNVVVADHHKSVFVYRIIDTQTGESEMKTIPATREELHSLVSGLADPALLFVEACRSWEWVSDLCEDHGVEIRLVNTSKIPEIWRSNKKNDHNDVEAMVDRLLLKGRLPEAYRATRPQRELRGLTRRLEELRKHRRTTLNRIHAVIDAQGMPAKKEQFSNDDWQSTAERLLPPDIWLVLEGYLIELGMLEEQQSAIEERVAELIATREDASRLRKIPGIGPIIAATIVAEVADITRFPSARKFAAYTGLVPRVRSSAGRPKHGRITRTGPSGLRWAMGHAVFASIRCKQASAATDFYRLKSKRGKPKKVAMCAAAHKLARIVYVVLSRGEDFCPPRRRRNTAAKAA